MDRQTLTDWAEHQTVSQAVCHLRAMGHDDIMIFYQGSQMLLSALLDLDSTYWRLSGRVPIQFVGGPPGKTKLVSASVKALLLDRAFRYLIHDGTMHNLLKLLKIQ